jgi:hypothetical protein
MSSASKNGFTKPRNVTVREAEAVVKPDRVADDLAREAVTFVRIGYPLKAKQ